MLKKITSLLLVISMLLTSVTVYAREKAIDVILNTNYRRGSEYIESCAVSELQMSPDQLRVSNVANLISSADDDFSFEEYEESPNEVTKETDNDEEKTIPSFATGVDNYQMLNEMDNEDEEDKAFDEYLKNDEVINGEITPVPPSRTYSSRTISTPIDAVYRMDNINNKDTFALKNQTGRTNYIGDNLGVEYVDPLTGNLIVTETDLVLPGVDGLDLNISRYYSLAEAEFYTKAVDIELEPEYNTFILENGGFVVTETITYSENETSTYNYFYLSENQAEKKKEEILSRNNDNSPYTYDANVIEKAPGECVTVDYYYTSKITTSSYSQQRYNLGAGWSWAFPSVEVIKDDYDNIQEIAKSIYYHDGKGNTMEVEHTGGNDYAFANYAGGDITFESSFEEYPEICGEERIDYIVTNPNGTKYYFGKYGEIRTVMDRYGNKITFHYQSKDTNENEEPYEEIIPIIIQSITDTIGREIEFNYSNNGGTFDNITVTVKSPNTSEGDISLTYKKRMLKINRTDINKVVTEPILEEVTNAIGEVTTYYPAMEGNEMKNAFPIQFTFADKSFNSEFVYNTSGYAYNLVYLLGNIVRPHSNTYYSYDMCERNLGQSGVSQAYRVAGRGDFELIIDGRNRILEEHTKNEVTYEYSRDYTGYPFYNSIENLKNYDEEIHPYVAKTKIRTGSSFISRKFYKINGALLQRNEYVEYTSPEENGTSQKNVLKIDSTVTTFMEKFPKVTRINYSNGYSDDNKHTYTSYIYTRHCGIKNELYGKPMVVSTELEYVPTYDEDIELEYEPTYNEELIKKQSIEYTYDTTTGFVTSKSWYKNNNVKCTETYTYDEENKDRLKSIKNAEGHEEKYDYTYDTETGRVNKRTITTTNDLGETIIEEIYTEETKFAFPSTVIKTVTAQGEELITTVETTSYEYNLLLGLVTSKTDTDGNTTYYEYDGIGRPTKIIYPPCHSYTDLDKTLQKVMPVEEFTYKTVLHDYDKVTDTNKYLIAQEIYSALSYYDITTSAESDPRNIDLTNMPETFYSAEMNYYMGTGELIEKNETVLVENEGEIATTTYYYDTEKNTVKVVDAQGNTTTTYYDGLGREVKVVDQFGNYHITEYNLKGDGAGFKSQSYFVPYADKTAKESISEVTYDRLNRVISEKAYSSYPESYVETKYIYDLVGNLIGIIDANENLNQDGYTESYEYDELNRVTKVKNANNEIIQNTYDSVGNIKTQTVNGQPLYTRYYDGEGKLVVDMDNGKHSNKYGYDAQGRFTGSINKNENTKEVRYNEEGFVDEEWYIKENSNIILREYGYTNPYSASIVYDWHGRRENDNTNFGVYLFSKQESGVTPSGAMAIKKTEYLDIGYNDLILKNYSHYMYDNIGNVTSTLHGSADEAGNVFGSNRLYTYENGRLSDVQISIDSDENTPNIPIAEYDYYPDGKLKSVSYPPLADGTALKSEYNYDELSRLSELTNYKGTAILSKYTYTYDKNGNITNISEIVETVGNETDFTYDNLNRIATVSGTKGIDSYYEYDVRGNRKANFEQVDFLKEDSISYTYNEENNLNVAEFSDSSVSYRYDVDGYRFAKYRSNQIPTFYLYDEAGRLQSEIQKINVYGQAIMYPIIEYIWGSDRVLAQLDIENNIYYYIYNGHGDVVQIVDTNGNIKNRYDYDVWGNFLKKEETIENHFTYFGQTYDEETGLYYLRARYYDPTIGRFTQQDPAEDGYNWYVYGNQNPVMYVDPSGEVATWVILALYEYAQAVVTSPDLQNDMQMLTYDISQGDYISAAFGLIDVLLPGISGSRMIPKFIRKSFDDVANWLGGVNTKNIEELISAKSLTSSHSKGARWIPHNLKESLAMETVLSNPSGKTIVGRDLMKDSRWLGSDGWVKKAQNVNGVEIHYNYNELTGKFDDFKFK